MASSAVTVSTSPSPASSSVLGADMTKYLDQIAATAEANNKWSAQQAAIQRDWQEQQNKLAMDFNAAEAAKNRDWQQIMSNTAHQREVADLQAAGLNPILSASGGNGAAVTSGATASGVTSSGAKGDTDTSANSAIVGLLGTIINAQNQLQMANLNAQTQLAVADKYNAMSEIVANIGAAAGIQQAGIHAGASNYSADMNYQSNLDALNQAKWMKENYPDTLVGAIEAIGSKLTGQSSAEYVAGKVKEYGSKLKTAASSLVSKVKDSWNKTGAHTGTGGKF